MHEAPSIPALPPFVELLSHAESVEFAEDWYEYNDVRHFWFEWRVRALKKLLAAVGLPLDRELLALDIGCGTGIVRQQLESMTQWTIDGTDLNLGALSRIAPGRGRARTFYYDILTRRPDLKAHYDAVILFDVIEHLESSAEFLKAVAFHMKPGAMLLINVPALESLRSTYDKVVGHYRRYDKALLGGEVSAAGFNVREMRYWGFSMVPLLWVRRLHLRNKEGRGTASVVKRGFQPPGAVTHALLRAIMRAETALIGRPPRGTSLLLAATAG